MQVHIEARLRELDLAGARFVVEETVREHDTEVGPEWMAERIDKLLPGVRAFEILVEGISGRFKLSQNRGTTDRENIVAALSDGNDDQRAIAELMDRMTSQRNV